VAVTFMFPEIVSVQLVGAGLVVHEAGSPAPLHPVNEAPATGEAVSLTCEPSANVPEAEPQLVPQERPAGAEVTEPFALPPALVTVSVRGVPTKTVTVELLFVRSGSVVPLGAEVAAVLTIVPEAVGEMVPKTLMVSCPPPAPPLKPRRGESEIELPVPLKLAAPPWSRHLVGLAPVPLPVRVTVQAQVTPVSCAGITSVNETLRPSEARI
jgi:hypothetical protein